jgi:YhcH/YjgK/YiaL family protein
MISDSLKNSARYEQIHPLFKQAFEYIKSSDFTQVLSGKIELIPGKLTVIIADIVGKEISMGTLETHNKYIDIQMPIIGSETIGWKPTEKLMNVSTPYCEENDITFFSDASAGYTTLTPGDFAIYFPEDGHAPGIGNGSIRKVIVKILVDCI